MTYMFQVKLRVLVSSWQTTKKNFRILNPCYQCVKKNNKKKTKKRSKKPCGNKKDFYFCTRIRAEVHTQTEVLNKLKKL